MKESYTILGFKARGDILTFIKQWRLLVWTAHSEKRTPPGHGPCSSPPRPAFPPVAIEHDILGPTRNFWNPPAVGGAQTNYTDHPPLPAWVPTTNIFSSQILKGICSLCAITVCPIKESVQKIPQLSCNPGTHKFSQGFWIAFSEWYHALWCIIAWWPIFSRIIAI